GTERTGREGGGQGPAAPAEEDDRARRRGDRAGDPAAAYPPPSGRPHLSFGNVRTPGGPRIPRRGRSPASLAPPTCSRHAAGRTGRPGRPPLQGCHRVVVSAWGGRRVWPGVEPAC